MTNNSKKIYFNIGLMKTGTTWLSEILKPQKNIFFTPEKEIHFFEMMKNNKFRDFDRRYDQFIKFSQRLKENENLSSFQKIKKLKWYMKYLNTDTSFDWFDSLFPQHADGYLCDFSNLSWKASKELWDEAFSRYASVKTSIILRSPIERLWSHTKFHFKIMHGRDFDLDEVEGINFVKKFDFIETSDYEKILKHLEQNLGLNNLLFLFQEDLKNKPFDSLRRIENHLGIKLDDEPIKNRSSSINATAKIELPKWISSNFDYLQEKSLNALEKRKIDYPESWKN